MESDTPVWISLVGHALTAGALLISMFGLLYAWHQHQDSKAHEEKNQLTITAATTLAKLERRQRQYGNYFFRVKPHFITASELFSRSERRETVRDFIWQKLEHEQSELIRELMEEEIEVAYVALAAFDPSLYTEFRTALQALDKAGEAHQRLLRWRVQDAVFDARDEQAIATAALSSTLRRLAANTSAELAKQSESLVAPVRARILARIQAPAGPAELSSRPVLSAFFARRSHAALSGATGVDR